MADAFETRLARTETLIRQLEKTPDRAVRASIKELVQSIMDLHGAAVGRMVEIAEQSECGPEIVDRWSDDALAGSLLILHGLHPQPIAVRVARAMADAAPALRKFDADIELEGVEEGVVRLRVLRFRSGAGPALKRAIEEQLYVHAPDVRRVDGLSGLDASAFIVIEALAGKEKDS